VSCWMDARARDRFYSLYRALRWNLLSPHLCGHGFGMVVAVHWNIRLTNREGRVGQNSGVTVINIEGGKVIQGRDFIFDLGDDFKLNWSAAWYPRS
jgi:hypothetical protein